MEAAGKHVARPYEGGHRGKLVLKPVQRDGRPAYKVSGSAKVQPDGEKGSNAGGGQGRNCTALHQFGFAAHRFSPKPCAQYALVAGEEGGCSDLPQFDPSSGINVTSPRSPEARRRGAARGFVLGAAAAALAEPRRSEVVKRTA